jgi:hypothetical protein
MDLIDRDGVGQAPDLDLPIARHDENPREPVLRPQMTDESAGCRARRRRETLTGRVTSVDHHDAFQAGRGRRRQRRPVADDGRGW